MDDLLSNGFHEKIMISQQTFVLMKTSSRRLLSSSSEDVFKTSLRCLDQDEYIRLTHTSSEDVFKTSWSRPIYSSWLSIFKSSSRHFQEVFKAPSRPLAKTSSRHLQDVFKTFWKCFQDVFKTFSRHLDQDEYICLIHTSSEDVFKTSWSRPIYSSWSCIFKTSSRCFQEVFKTPSRSLAKTSAGHLQDVFKTFSRRL